MGEDGGDVEGKNGVDLTVVVAVPRRPQRCRDHSRQQQSRQSRIPERRRLRLDHLRRYPDRLRSGPPGRHPTSPPVPD